MHIEVLTDFNDFCGSRISQWTVSSRTSSLLLCEPILSKSPHCSRCSSMQSKGCVGGRGAALVGIIPVRLHRFLQTSTLVMRFWISLETAHMPRSWDTRRPLDPAIVARSLLMTILSQNPSPQALCF